jgi:large subunit ribosomal protein L32
MPVPKRKMPRSRTRKRRSTWRGKPAAYAECPQCHKPKLPHRACPNCGTYNGRQVVQVE